MKTIPPKTMFNGYVLITETMPLGDSDTICHIVPCVHTEKDTYRIIRWHKGSEPSKLTDIEVPKRLMRGYYNMYKECLTVIKEKQAKNLIQICLNLESISKLKFPPRPRTNSIKYC